jgi:hypothetical protein
MRVGPILCFVLAGVSAFAAVNHVVGAANPPGAAYIVGLSVLPIIFLVGGIASWRKAKK